MATANLPQGPVIIGAKVPRIDGALKTTGSARYAVDHSFPNLAHAFAVQSTIGKGRIHSLDASAAEKMPGVLLVLHHGNMDGAYRFFPHQEDGTISESRPPFDDDKIYYWGQYVAVVVAETLEQAKAAAQSVKVDYDAETPDVRTDLGAGFEGKRESSWRRGDSDRALAEAPVVIDQTYVTPVETHNPMEMHGTVAVWDGENYTLYESTQGVVNHRTVMSEVLGVPRENVRVISRFIGSGFGGKLFPWPQSTMAAVAARKLKRPVRWIADRTEGFQTDEQARDVAVKAELALDGDGNFLAVRFRYDIDIGAYLSGRSLAPINNIGGVAGVYRTPRILAEAYGVFTNTVPTAPYRGAGRPEATYTIERLIDVAARELGIDRFELRRRNLIPAAAMPHKTDLTFTYDCGDFAGNMDAAARVADLAGFPARREDAARRDKLRGLGIANPIEVAGGPFGKPAKDNAMIRVAGDGTVTLLSGAMSTGQGIETAFSQLVAQRLGIPIEHVRYAQGSTDQLPSGRGSGGSSALCVGGAAVGAAAEQVVEHGRAFAAELLEAAAADIEFANGRFIVAGTDRSASLAEVARFADDPRRVPPGTAPGLAGAGEFQPPAVTFPNGCHIAEVEIDPETGLVALLSYCLAEDVGRVFNPLLLEGQMHGGIAQGAGQALGETIVYDGATGQLLTASFMDYQMPRAGDVAAAIRMETREVPSAVNPLGAKGVGEAGTVGAMAAVMNAVCDALAPLGVRHLDMPATPARVWAAIHAAKR